MKVHIHTDCHYFAGCEMILADVLTDQRILDLHDVSISYRSSPRYEDGLQEWVKNEVPIHSLSIPVYMPPTSDFRFLPKKVSVGMRSVVQYFLGPIYSLIDVWRIHQVLRHVNPDVIYINNGGYPGSRSARAAVIAARIRKIPSVVMRVHNFAVPYSTALRIIELPLDRLVARWTSKFICGSFASARQLRKVLCLQDDKIEVIHNGIPSLVENSVVSSNIRHMLNLSAESIIVGVVAALESRKGLYILFHALAEMSIADQETLQNIHLVVAGEGPERERLEALVRELKLSGHIKFLGQIADGRDFIRGLDILVVPSVREEDTPNVIYEAMVVGVPVIATDLGGIREQIEDHVSGIIVKPGDPVALRFALCKLASDSLLRGKYGKESRERFRRMFTVDLSIAQHLQLFDKLGDSHL